MVLVVTDVHDIVPPGGVVTFKTLIDARRLLARKLLRDHGEVLHEMTRRRPVALHTFFGTRRRMQIVRNKPGCKDMTRCAVAAEAL